MGTILSTDKRNQIIDSMGWSLDGQERGDMHKLIEAVLTEVREQEHGPVTQITDAMIDAANRTCRNDERCGDNWEPSKCQSCRQETAEDLKAALLAVVPLNHQKVRDAVALLRTDGPLDFTQVIGLLEAAMSLPAVVPPGYKLVPVELLHRVLDSETVGGMSDASDELRAMLAAAPEAPAQPIDMILHCPACGMQHIDAPESLTVADLIRDDGGAKCLHGDLGEFEPWTNPPHRSHLCHGCGHIWRPADVPTNGVAAIKTKGKADSPVPEAPAQADEGKVVVTWDHDRTRILAVTRQNAEGQVLKVIAAAPEAPARECGLCGSDTPFTGSCGGGRENPRALCFATPERFCEECSGINGHHDFKCSRYVAPEAATLPAEVREALNLAQEALEVCQPRNASAVGKRGAALRALAQIDALGVTR